MVHICKMIIPSRFFFYFFKILIFWIDRGVKRQKTVQNGKKKLCLLRSISQEPYIIWLSFMVQICKMIISPGVSFNFKILIFWVARGLKGQEMDQNDKNFCLSQLIFQESYIIWSTFYGTHVSPGIFFVLFKILLFRIIRRTGRWW